MRAYGDTVVCAAGEACARIAPGDRLRMADTMIQVSLAVICRAFFGVDHELPRWMDLLRGPIESISPIALFVPATQHPLKPAWRRLQAARGALDEAIDRTISGRRAHGAQGEDILSLMLNATCEDGSTMDDHAMRDERVSLLFAGHETTQIRMAWASRLFHGDPCAWRIFATRSMPAMAAPPSWPSSRAGAPRSTRPCAASAPPWRPTR